ncbi:AI-2E family transporter [Kocuria sp. NPDC057446]|uniref:AI-2E family transporter n=1 Tax=Kocuria sp. NPDC057446 TaxID=3346137 RepID=UPI0036B8E83B
MTNPSPTQPSDQRTGSSGADAVLAAHDRPDPPAETTDGEGTGGGPPVASAAGPWSDALGRAGSRAAQVLLVAVVVAGIVWLLLRVTVVVIALLVALILAAAVSPLVQWLVGKEWSHLWATLAAFLGILVLLGGLVTGVVLAISNEWDDLVSSAEEGWQELQEWVASGPLPIDTIAIDTAIRQVIDVVTDGSIAGNVADSAVTGIAAATEVLTGAVLTIVILFFFLKDGHRMWNFALRWFRGSTRAKLAESADRSAEVLGGYMRGIAIIALVDALIIGIGLALVGIPLVLPLAVIVFIGAFVPLIGATVAGIFAALVALVTAGPVEALIVVAIVVVVNQLEGDLLEPVIMGNTLSLHALVVLLALTVGTLVGGIPGAVLAVPYTAVAWKVIQVCTDRYQTGQDPMLGEDPLGPEDRVSEQATMAERWTYQRMRRRRRRRNPGAAEQDSALGTGH